MIRPVLLLCLVASTFARMAYFLPGGVEFGRKEPFVKDFSCIDHSFGFYADVANSCNLYHLCEPVWDNDGNFVEIAHYSFACGTGTVFSQRDLACDHPAFASSCSDAPNIYDSSNIGAGVQLVARNEVRRDDDYDYEEEDE